MNHYITDSRGLKKSKQSPKSSKCMQFQQGQFGNFNPCSSFTTTTTTSTQPPPAAPPHVFQSSLHSPTPTRMSNPNPNPNPNSHPCIYISPTPMHFSFSNHLCHPMDQEEDQEADHKVTATPSSSSSRWNPTKEQITILEGLYKQGIRTPTAEQIQQITSRLKQYGCIEGKNVFYWFQNHKARQRQKQRQETFSYFTTLLHPPPPPPPPCNSAVYLQGHYHHHHHHQVGSIGFYQQPLHQCQNSMHACANVRIELKKAAAMNGFSAASDGHDQTLELFPLHPTGILEGKCASSNERLEDGDEEIGIGGENMTLFNFFGSQRLC